MKNYYECHVTMTGDVKELRSLVERHGWKFSAIDGDPVMGSGVKCYATMLYNLTVGQQECVDRTVYLAIKLGALGANILRRKAELVVFDDRSALAASACDGACCEMTA